MGKKIRKYHLQHELCEYTEYIYEYTTIQKFCFLRKLVLLLSKGALNCSKVTVKTDFNLYFITQLNAVLLNFLFIKESRKTDYSFPKYEAAQLFFNIDN